jgi:uncharacterized protein YndB with AHSA1/START domain
MIESLGDEFMTDHSVHEIRIEKSFSASCERVFDAWFDTHHLATWLFHSDKIVSIKQDSQVGGKFSYIVNRAGKSVEHLGKFLELSRPNYLTFTWELPQESPHTSTVKITLEVVEQGSKLTLTHKGVLDGTQDLIRTNWAQILDHLEDNLT